MTVFGSFPSMILVSFLEMCECLLAGTRSGWKNRRRIAKATRRSLTTIGLIKPTLTTFLKTTAILVEVLVDSRKNKTIDNQGSSDGLNNDENENKEPSKSPVTVVRHEPKPFEKLESAPPSPSCKSDAFDHPERLSSMCYFPYMISLIGRFQ